MRFDKILFLVTACIITVECKCYNASKRSFTYNVEEREFLLNGEPIRLISGSIHYFRIAAEYWNDRLKKIRACGFNAIQV